MSIEPGQAIPAVPIKHISSAGTVDVSTSDVLGRGLVVFFTVPGAFTPTCHTNHLPGFLANAGKMRAAGVDRIVCGSVNDAHVMQAWAEATDALQSIDFIADGTGAFARALGLEKNFGALGQRFARSAMIIRDGVVQSVFVEDAPGVSGSGAPAILLALEAAGK